MKKTVTLILTLMTALGAIAQAPQKMSYQAVIRNASNQLLTNQLVGIQISILQGSASGTAVYVETQTPSTNVNGLVTLEIGEGNAASGSFAGIDWPTGTYFIKTEIDPTGGTNYAMEGTSQLLTVPYALYSSKSGNDIAFRQQLKIVEDNLINAGLFELEDIDGNQYDITKIGSQVWMAENLKTTRYNDGTVIPNITDTATWINLTTGAISDYSNISCNSNIYGRLYNWYAADNNPATKSSSNGGKNVCPTGWHIPSDLEWTTLTDFLTNNGYSIGGDNSNIAKSLANTSGWNDDPTSGNIGNDQTSNDSSAFSALPGGYRDCNGLFGAIGDGGYWWSSTISTSYVDFRCMLTNNGSVLLSSGRKQNGFSVRCLRD